MDTKVTLERVEHGVVIDRVVFDRRTTCVAGRASDCMPRLANDTDHGTVSRRHCLFEVDPPAIRVRDLGSCNGTYVNGRLIGQRGERLPVEGAAGTPGAEHALADGDEVRLGNTVLRVHVAGPAVGPGEDAACGISGTEAQPRRQDEPSAALVAVI
jgi:pSer/pThr/pTyr-binding forkhead associated (FHA) protein